MVQPRVSSSRSRLRRLGCALLHRSIRCLVSLVMCLILLLLLLLGGLSFNLQQQQQQQQAPTTTLVHNQDEFWKSFRRTDLPPFLTRPHSIVGFCFLFGAGGTNATGTSTSSSRTSTTKHYVRMFAESVRYAEIDVVLMGDSVPSFALPPNMKHVYMTWDQLVDRVAERVFPSSSVSSSSSSSSSLEGLRHARHWYYKVNDLKPLAAVLFPELVAGYDFWGHLDNDMVLGNVRQFLTTERLNQHDVIGVLSRQPTYGPFTFYRNDAMINRLLFLSEHPLKSMLNTPINFAMDEWGLPLWRNVRETNFHSTISGVIVHYEEKLGIRWDKSNIPFFWDGSCSNSERYCGCVYSRDNVNHNNNNNNKSNVKLVRHPLGHQDYNSSDRVLCHFLYGKKRLEESLQDPIKRKKLIDTGSYSVCYDTGFDSFTTTTTIDR